MILVPNPELIFAPTADLKSLMLQPGQVDVWRYPLTGELTDVIHYLNDEDRARCLRFHFPIHQRRFAFAHQLMRIILAQYAGSTVHELVFEAGLQGKPILSSHPTIHFNLSHSEDTALLAIAFQPVGVDLEYFSARPYYGIAKTLFSHQEQQLLAALNPLQLPMAFFTIWAQKEALIKANGMGLSYPMDTVDVPLLPHNTVQVHDIIQNKAWHLKAYMPEIGCAAAICYDPAITSIRHLTIHHSTPFMFQHG